MTAHKQQLTSCVIYCRVSDEEQVKKGHGLKSQEAVCREFARYRGYEVVEVFHENLSGKYTERPVMKELLAYLRRHKHEAVQIERQVEKLLDRVVEAGTDSVIRAYEKRIAGLERQALVLREKSEKAGQRKEPFDELFKLAVQFLANPGKLWSSGKMEYRNLVLRLTFADRLQYCAESGFQTPKTTFPFSILSDMRAAFEQVAEGVRFELTVGLHPRRFSRPP